MLNNSRNDCSGHMTGHTPPGGGLSDVICAKIPVRGDSDPTLCDILELAEGHSLDLPSQLLRDRVFEVVDVLILEADAQ